jgi:hypothetical protein
LVETRHEFIKAPPIQPVLRGSAAHLVDIETGVSRHATKSFGIEWRSQRYYREKIVQLAFPYKLAISYWLVTDSTKKSYCAISGLP